MDPRLPAPGCTTCHHLLDRYCALTSAVLELARRDLGRFDFLWRVAQAVLRSSGADGERSKKGASEGRELQGGIDKAGMR